MTPDENLARARALLGDAYDLWYRHGGEPWPEQIAALEGARTAATIACGYIALAQESRERLADEWRLIATGPDLSPVAPVTPIKRPKVGDVKDCEYCGVQLRSYAYDNGRVREVESGRLHSCPPPEPMRAPAEDTAEAPTQHPRKD